MIKFFTKKMSNKKGFTLIELVVVIAILGILAAIAIPRLSGSRANANRKALIASLRTLDSALTIAEADGLVIDEIDALVPNYLAAPPKVTNASFDIKVVNIIEEVKDDDDNIITAAITGKRAVASIDNAGTFGAGETFTEQTVEQIQALGAMWQ